MREKGFVGYLICLFGFGLTYWSFFPGAMSADSIGNLMNGRAGVFFDINSPIISYTWGLLDTIVPGPALMFALQNLLFWGACAIFWYCTYRRSFLLGIGLTVFGFTPHILSSLTVVWKDIGMGVAIFFAVALIYLAKEKKSIVALVLSAFFLLFGCAARLNSVVAVIPIAIWSGYVLFAVLGVTGRKTLPAIVGIAYLMMLGVGAYAITYSLTKGHTTYPFQQNYLYDLAAISAERGEVLFPEYVVRHELFVPELVAVRYNTRTVNDLLYKDIPLPGDKQILTFTENPDEIAALRAKWMEVVAENPGAYLRHRTKLFANLIGLSRGVPATQLYEGFTGNPPEYRGSENLGYRVLMKYFHAFRRPFPQTFFFRAFIWMLICGFLLYKAWSRWFAGAWDIVAVLSVSCIVYTLAHFPTTPSTEFRYLFWPAIATAVAVVFGIYLLRKEKAEGVSAGEGLR